MGYQDPYASFHVGGHMGMGEEHACIHYKEGGRYMSMGHGMSNEQLVARIKAGEDVAGNMLQLYGQVRGFISSTAWKYRGYAEVEDLEQEGYLALYPAIDGYDPAAGCRFLTYAGRWINQRMVRYIQDSGTIRIPVHEQERIQQYRRLERVFLSQMGRGPSDQEAAYYLGLTLKELRALGEAMGMGEMQSLDACYTEDGDTTLGDTIPGAEDVERGVLDKMEQGQLRAVLWAEVDSLPGEQPQVIRSLFQEGHSLGRVGEGIGDTKWRVRAIKESALRELRKPSHSRKLRPFLPEAVEGEAYRHIGVREFDRTWTSSTERAAMELLKGGARQQAWEFHAAERQGG